MRETFKEHKFTPEKLRLLAQASIILDEYKAKGYVLTLRQLYYQLVSRAIIENSIKSYKRTSILIGNGRLAGLLDWDMIEDRNREIVYPSHWDGPADIIRSAARSFRIDLWENQPCYCEVMVEKDALSGILVPVCNKLDIRFTANKGYSSLSAMYEAGRRFGQAVDQEKECHLFYLGDHDPSGIDMTRDVTERIELFSWCDNIEVHRLALNMDQVKEWKPPENPAKDTDARFEGYRRRFGEYSWELDAVKPEDLADLVINGVDHYVDWDIFDEDKERQDAMIQKLKELADQADIDFKE